VKPFFFGLAIIGLAFIAGLAGYLYQANNTVPEGVENLVNEIDNPTPIEEEQVDIIGRQRPEFSMQDVHGQLRHIDEWDGQVIAINFWATWCAPCLKEIPEFVHLQEKYSGQGLQFIGIALQKPEEVLGFIEETGMNYPVMAGEMEVVDLARLYGNELGALPYTVIIDKEGVVAFVKLGQLSGEEAEKVITRLL